MHILRAFGLVLLSFVVTALPIAAAAAETNDKANENPKTVSNSNQPKPQQLVEEVDIQGNRRLRDEDLLYYIKTRAGDVFNPQQLERDLRELLSLNFFDKTATRVLTEEGVRGGVRVIFEVRELPIIRDLRFEGNEAVPESDILKQFREQRVGISKEAVFDPVKVNAAKRVIRELLAAKGFPNATITEKVEEVSATSVAVTFDVDQGRRSRIVDIQFEGNEIFKDSELRGALQLVRETGLISRFQGQDILDLRKLQYDLQKNVREYMFSKGYFQARIGEPQVEGLGVKRTDFIPLITLPLPLISSKDDTLRIIVPVTEGKLYRVGDIKVEGNSIFSEQQILNGLGLKKGEVADGQRLRKSLFEDLKKAYGSQGFVLYDAELDPQFKDNPANPNEGIVDINIVIDEGKQFRLRRLEFAGNTFTRDRVLRREVLINEGDIYNQLALETSVIRLNQTQYFDPIDKDKDVEIRTDEETGDVDLIVNVKEKGRQQISFNGGISGIGGSFFGLEYSTNNLFGRGEVFAFNAGFGNRQTTLQLSFTEPYFKDRPISIGFSLFASRYKFFGEGTFLSQNQDLFFEAQNPFGTVLTNEDNLFTQTTYGASVFATAPLSEFLPKRRFSQFSRVGLTYQFSATSIADPPVNAEGNAATEIPIVFRQPNITTSRITPSFVYDSRQPSANGIDTLRGTQLAASIGFAGLGGDVRTYQPNLTFTHFMPVRRRSSQNAEVFGFRIQAGTIGAWSVSNAVNNANSLAFVNGVPFTERYFLGSEFDLRGYNVRAIGPIAPVDTFITSRNVVVASNPSGTPTPITGIPAERLAEIAALGTFTGSGGANPGLISQSFTYIGGDTQLLGNFEYRVPIFGPISLAAFADIGSVFNLRKGETQVLNSAFLTDQPFLGAFNSLNIVFLRNNTQFQPSFSGGLLLRDNRPITRSEFQQIYCGNSPTTCPITVPAGLQEVFLRGDAQTNQLVRVGDSRFAKLGDFRSSVGLELRVQVPIVNVPFRLIYYYNPNAKIGFTEELPNFFLPGKRNGFRFSVGRTF
ncbi:MAG TPA: outer membrane protein assembly factor BamA [Pyrinomonadaceae bacterium]|jgi:outer membrane protein insertion porin family